MIFNKTNEERLNELKLFILHKKKRKWCFDDYFYVKEELWERTWLIIIFHKGCNEKK